MTAQELVEALRQLKHHQKVYDVNHNNTISTKEADSLGYYPDERGHRDDRVKLANHPTHPSRGTFVGKEFKFSDKGMQDPNYTLFGLVDNGDDDAIPTYNNSIVLPEITVTPKGNYYMNTYDGVKMFGGGGKYPYIVDSEDRLIRTNSDGTTTLFPFIKGSTYTKYKSSPEFMKTLELAFNRYAHRVGNEYKQRIPLSGKTKSVAVKGEGTFHFPEEVFNSIVSASESVGIDPKQGLAIAIKESSGYTHPDRRGFFFGGLTGENTWKAIKSKNNAGPAAVVSNWQYFNNSPYIGLLKGWERSGWDVKRVSDDAQYQYRKHQKEYDKYDSNLDEDIFINMFKLPLEKINPNQKDYVSTIKKYMSNMSYKLGGKLK